VITTRRRATFHFQSGIEPLEGVAGRGAAVPSAECFGFGFGIGASLLRAGGRSGTLLAFEPNEEKAQVMPAKTSSRGMSVVHQALRAGGALEGIPLKRHSSHSPL